ncbi:MAG: helix-turn-helix domain-containing protein [Terriglobia bacterium]
MREFKRSLILRILRDCDGSKSEAARRLGIARGYLHRLLNQLHIEEGRVESVADVPEVGTPVM